RVVFHEATRDRRIGNPMKTSGDGAPHFLPPSLGELDEQCFTRDRRLEGGELGSGSFAFSRLGRREVLPPALRLRRLVAPIRPFLRSRHACRIARVTSVM